MLALCFWRIIELTPGDLLPAMFLCMNKLAPPYEHLELGIGEFALTLSENMSSLCNRSVHAGGSLLSKAIMQATGRNRTQMHAMYVEKGDLGLVAQVRPRCCLAMLLRFIPTAG